MPSDPARATRSGRILKETSTATSTPRSRQRGSSSNLQTSRSNRAKKQTKPASPPSNSARAVVTEELTAQGKERVRQFELESGQAAYIHDNCLSGRSHHGYRTSQSPSTASTSSREHRGFAWEADHKHAGTICSSIHCRISLVAKTLVEKLYRGDLEARDLPQSLRSYTAYIFPKTDMLDAIPKLLRWMENYGQIVCHFAPPASEIELQRALSCFRVQLLEHLGVYTFQSVCEWCTCFVAKRIKLGEHDPAGWTDRAPELQHKLVPL